MASFDAACLDRQEREKDINIRLLSPEVAADFIMSWPIELTVPTIPIYVRGSNPITRKTYRFKCTTGSNFPVPLDGPLSMDHVHFLLDCFVVSSGPERIHLGRYHPQSDPEQFVTQNRHVNTSCPNSEEAYFSRLRAERGARPSIMPPDTTLVMPESYNPDEYTFKSYFVDFPIKADRSSSYSLSDLVPSSDDIMREVEGVKVILEPLLDGHDLLDWERAHYLTEVLHMLPEGDLNPPAPHFPVGDLENEECGICYETQYMYRRACCSFPACNHCLKRYYASKVENGQVKIECCNPNCKKFVHREEISARLDGSTKEKFNTLLLLANQDENTKTCPRCNHLTEFDKAPKVPRDPNYPNYPR
ncbi:uncharacterized protein NPIL_647191 [Nephila pilipes]|uniref:RING-type domain-containing protein n=1 Tax=Nephila pilipes TaxID=299642 RepID=A0A8X6M8Z4_NEPPI|nr:uncharacterized protein NPIL_647191 [Nephila pilipes]